MIVCRRLVICLLAPLLVTSEAKAAFEHREVGARSIAISGGCVALSEGQFWSPAGIGGLTQAGFSSFYGSTFSMRELSLAAISYAQPTQLGNFGVGLSLYGFNLYQELTFWLCYGRKVIQRLAAGLCLRDGRLKIQDFGSDSALCLDVGFLAEVSQKLNWGINLYNITGARIGNDGEKLAQSLTTGVSFHLSDELVLALDVQKDSKFPLQFCAGGEYRISEHLALRTGVGNNPSRFSAGIGFYLGRISLDYALYTHLVLGSSHQVSFNVDLGTKEGNSR